MLRSPYLIAALIALCAVAWLYSGRLSGDAVRTPQPSLAELREQNRSQLEDREPTRVRARLSHAQLRVAQVSVRGRTHSNRSVLARAEVSGRVQALPLDKGDRVAAGDIICRLDPQDRAARVIQAREAVRQAQLDYEGALRLQRSGLHSQTAIAANRARLAAARADLVSRELDLANSDVRAPFGGIIEERPVEVGDFLQPGATCARIIEQDPMLLIGQVAERDVFAMRVGTPASARLIDGTEVRGTLKFIAQEAAPGTRTYAIEVAVPNPGLSLRSGVTAEIKVPVGTHLAHRIPPSLLTLDDQGRMGVRLVDDDDRVQFVHVDIISDDARGLWIAGLPDVARIITVGQELVVPGELVDVVLEVDPQMPVATPKPGSTDGPPTPALVPRRSNSPDNGAIDLAGAAT